MVHSYTKGKNDTEKLLLEQTGKKRKNGRKYILLNEDDYFPLSSFLSSSCSLSPSPCYTLSFVLSLSVLFDLYSLPLYKG